MRDTKGVFSFPSLIQSVTECCGKQFEIENDETQQNNASFLASNQ
jgi:hypothetical protein